MAAFNLSEHILPAIELSRVYLLHAHFEDGGPGADGNGADYLVDLSVSRSTLLDLSVAVTLSTPEDAPVRLSVSYGADFLLPENASEEDREEVMREAAYRLAPPMLYSYIRQLIDEMTGRGRGRRVTLPFLPMPLDVAHGEERIPPPPGP